MCEATHRRKRGRAPRAASPSFLASLFGRPPSRGRTSHFSNTARTATSRKDRPERTRGDEIGARAHSGRRTVATLLFRDHERSRPRRDRGITGGNLKGQILLADGQTPRPPVCSFVRARARAPRRTLCAPGIDRWIAAIHRRSRDSRGIRTQVHRTPLSRASHLASRTSASPGRVSLSPRRVTAGLVRVTVRGTTVLASAGPPSTQHGQRHVGHLVLAAVPCRVTTGPIVAVSGEQGKFREKKNAGLRREQLASFQSPNYLPISFKQQYLYCCKKMGVTVGWITQWLGGRTESLKK